VRTLTRNLALTATILVAAGSPAWAAIGDCDGDLTVRVNELVTAVNIALDPSLLSQCTAADGNSDGQVKIEELIGAVKAALTPPPIHTVGSYEGYGVYQGSGNYITSAGGAAFKNNPTVAPCTQNGLQTALSVSNRYVTIPSGCTLTLTEPITLSNVHHVTLSGWESQGNAITLQNRGILITDGSHDIVITNVRVRGAQRNGIGVDKGSYNVVLDHVTVSDPGDVGINIAGRGGQSAHCTQWTNRVTVSWSLVVDGPNANPDPPPAEATVVGKGMYVHDLATNVTAHHNLLLANLPAGVTKAIERQPLVGWAAESPGGTCIPWDPPATDAAITMDAVNNLVWGWGAVLNSGEGTKFRKGARGNVTASRYDSRGNATSQGAAFMACSPGASNAGCKPGETDVATTVFADASNIAAGSPNQFVDRSTSIERQVVISGGKTVEPPRVMQGDTSALPCELVQKAGARRWNSGTAKWVLDAADDAFVAPIRTQFGCS
jgi:hypothetical protein